MRYLTTKDGLTFEWRCIAKAAAASLTRTIRLRRSWFNCRSEFDAVGRSVCCINYYIRIAAVVVRNLPFFNFAAEKRKFTRH